MNRSLLILTAVLGCAALHLACSRSEPVGQRSEPVARESDPDRPPRLDEMSPEDRSIILSLHELAARQAAAALSPLKHRLASLRLTG